MIIDGNKMCTPQHHINEILKEVDAALFIIEHYIALLCEMKYSIDDKTVHSALERVDMSSCRTKLINGQRELETLLQDIGDFQAFDNNMLGKEGDAPELQAQRCLHEKH